MKLKGQLLTANASIVLADGAAGQTTLTSTGTGTRVLSLPDATDTLVGKATTDTLTNKTLTSPTINGGTLTGVTIAGSTLTLDDSDSDFNLTLTSTSTLTEARTLTLDVEDGARTVTLGGNLTLAAALTTSGANALTLTTTGSTNVTLPTSGTLATLAGTETLTNKTLTSPTLTTPNIGVATATSVNGLTITSSTGTLTVTNGKTLSVSNTLTLTGTDSSSVSFGAGGTVVYTSNKLSVHASTSSSELAGVISDETGSGSLVFGTSPTIDTPTVTAPVITGGATLRGNLVLQNASGSQPELHLSEDPDNGTSVIKLKAPAALGGDVTFTLPDNDGNANEVLATDGNGVLSWAAALSSSLNQYNVTVGNSSNAATATDTSLLGDIKASVGSFTFVDGDVTTGTDTIAETSHGMSTADKVYLTNSGGALPAGLSASTAYYVIRVDANSFKLASSRDNAVAGTAVDITAAASGGTHTVNTGGLVHADGHVYSGTYTPTLTNGTNVAASVASPCWYSRVGNVVTVSGYFTADLTTADSSSVLYISLPIASNFALSTDAAGVVMGGGQIYATQLYADTSGDRLELDFKNTSDANLAYTFTAQYVIK